MSVIITSSSNEKIKEITKLTKSAKERNKKSLFVVEGIRMVREISDDMIDSMYVSETGLKRYADEIDENKITAVVADKVFEGMSDTGTPQGVMALVKMPHYEYQDVVSGGLPFILVMDRLQDPGNMGTIIRTAEAAGVTGIIVSRDSVDVYSPKVVRSTMGAIFRVPVYVSDNLVTDINRMKEEGVTVYGAHLDGKEFYDYDYKNPSAFLIGNEGNGLSCEVSETADRLIKIPMKGKVESLNAAMSTTVIAYEVLRQRL